MKDALERPDLTRGRAAGDVDQGLPGFECHNGHCGQNGWEILGKCLLHCPVWTWEPQGQKFLIHPTLRTLEEVKRVTG